jgi:hypothetical protein
MMSAPVCKILATEICAVDLFFEKWPHIESVNFILPEEIDISIAEKIKEKLLPGKTCVKIYFSEKNKKLILQPHKKFMISFDILQELQITHNINFKINLNQKNIIKI